MTSACRRGCPRKDTQLILFYAQIALTIIGIVCLAAGVAFSTRNTVAGVTQAIRFNVAATVAWVLCVGAVGLQARWLLVAVYAASSVFGVFTIRSARRTRRSYERIAEIRAGVAARWPS